METKLLTGMETGGILDYSMKQKDKLTYPQSFYYLEMISGFNRTVTVTKRCVIVLVVFLLGVFFLPVIIGVCKNSPLYIDKIKNHIEIIKLTNEVNE